MDRLNSTTPTPAASRAPVRRRAVIFLALAGLLSMGTVMSDANAAGTQPDPANTAYLDLKDGRVVVALRPDLAPKTVHQFKQLCQSGFYNGTPFHRVIEGFMAQGGDPTGTGTGGSKLPNVPAEFSPTAHFLTGTLGMARSADPNSGNSQFFIMFAPNPHLDGNYTIFGQVVDGMQYVDNIKRGTGANGMVTDPDRLIKCSLAVPLQN
jgi:peptidylprolyl isomerase